jgi:hypothetical protein
VLAELRAGQQFIDQFRPLVGLLAGEELFDLVRGRDDADQVKVGAADELGVVAKGRP